MWKERVSSESNATHHLTLSHAITRSHGYAASLHMHEQAVLSIQVIEHHEIADIFGIFARWKFRVPDFGAFRIFKPVFRYVICGCENNSCTRSIDRLPVSVPILEDARIIVILPSLPIYIDEVAGEII